MFDTQLTPQQESDFQNWLERQRQTQNIYPTDTGEDYDFRGAYMAGLQPGNNGHWEDTFKKPNHPTFSNYSQYAQGLPAGWAGMWLDNTFIPNAQPQQHPLLQALSKLLQ